MSDAIRELIQVCTGCKTMLSVLEAIEKHFDGIVWSLEKEEWLRMTSGQRNKFADKILKEINRGK